MELETARKIGEDVGGQWTDNQRREAFSVLCLTGNGTSDVLLYQNIWRFFGNNVSLSTLD